MWSRGLRCSPRRAACCGHRPSPSQRQLEGHVPLLCRRFNAIVEHHLNPQADYLSDAWHVELLIVDHHWQTLGLSLSATDFTDAEAVAAVARISGGNFRLIHRRFAQIRRCSRSTSSAP